MRSKIFGGLILLVFLVSCVPTATGTTAVNGTQPMDVIQLPMGYIPNVQFAPFYVALDKGYFRQEGIDLQFDYKFETDGVALVGAGQIPFALVSGDQVPLARAQELPVVYVMAWWNGYPVAVTFLQASGIQTIADLKGKKVGIPVLSGASYVGFRALINSVGLKEDEVALEVVGYNQVEALISGKIDAAVVYANNEPIQLRARGYQIGVIRVADHVDLASNGLLASEKILQENPDLVRRMIRAVLHGVEDTIANPDGAYTICRKYVDGLAADDPIQREVLSATMDFWKAETPGVSDLAAWQNMEATLRSMGLLTGTLDITKAFTNDYLP